MWKQGYWDAKKKMGWLDTSPYMYSQTPGERFRSSWYWTVNQFYDNFGGPFGVPTTIAGSFVGVPGLGPQKGRARLTPEELEIFLRERDPSGKGPNVRPRTEPFPNHPSQTPAPTPRVTPPLLPVPAAAVTPQVRRFDTLNIGGAGEAPVGANVIQVNIDSAELVGAMGAGAGVVANGNQLPFANSSFRHVQGNYVPPDNSVAPGVVREGFRVLEPGGTAVFSSAGRDMSVLMREAGFTNIRTIGLAPRTSVAGRVVPPAIQYQGTRPSN
jgi:hypothetical protein